MLQSLCVRQLLRTNQHSKAESCKWSELLAAGVQGLLKRTGRFGFLMLKYAFSHILQTFFILFLTASSTLKTDKSSTLHYTLINFRNFYVITAKFAIFYIFMKKLCLLLFEVCKVK